MSAVSELVAGVDEGFSHFLRDLAGPPPPPPPCLYLSKLAPHIPAIDNCLSQT